MRTQGDFTKGSVFWVSRHHPPILPMTSVADLIAEFERE
jgi:hypothetical protein